MERQPEPPAGGGWAGSPLTDADLADPPFWRRPLPERMTAFARLRQFGPPEFFVERKGSALRPRRGFYALVRHADVVEASRRPDVFISEPGVTTPPPARWVRIVFGDSMVNLDDPRHARMRRIISRAFTPRVLAGIEEDIRQVATQIVDDVATRKPDDFVSSVATRMPFQVICNMMGIPDRHRDQILGQVNRTMEHTGVRRDLRQRLRVPGRGLRAMVDLHRLVAATGRERRGQPADDLISALVNTNVEGKYLTSRELGSFFSLLLVAGVETTRNAITHGLKLLSDHPEQKRLLLSDLDHHIAGTVEEIVRHSSPIIQFRRTLADDYEMNGHAFAKGDNVVLFYNSANRDEAVFTDPDAFDITREPNPHVGFGGGGPHFCLGAHLARQEMTVLFRELFTRLPHIRSVGEPDFVASNFDNRIRRLRFTFDPPQADQGQASGRAPRS